MINPSELIFVVDENNEPLEVKKILVLEKDAGWVKKPWGEEVIDWLATV